MIAEAEILSLLRTSTSQHFEHSETEASLEFGRQTIIVLLLRFRLSARPSASESAWLPSVTYRAIDGGGGSGMFVGRRRANRCPFSAQNPKITILLHQLINCLSAERVAREPARSDIRQLYLFGPTKVSKVF